MSKITMDQISELLAQAKSGRVNRENLQNFLRNHDGENKAQKFTVTIDYGKSLSEMIAAGRYDWKNNGINEENFPVSGTGKVTLDLELIHLGKEATTEEVLAYMEAQGLRPAKIEELLAFGATYPESQREFPVIALGSVWRNSHGYDAVPYLYRNGAERSLNLNYYGSAWADECRFLAVRK